ncbi:MAG: hypothetical protein OEQ74_00820 [Gammaproteobacteria bacterium]|nr:hypothetical protein [Gammaproteobacteria bacterium]
MNVRRLIVALLAMAIAPLAYAESGAVVVGETVVAHDFSMTHIDDLAVIDTEVDVMGAVLQPMEPRMVKGGGKIVHEAWYDEEGVHRETFKAIVGVRVPSKVPGFDTIKGAMNADLRLVMSANGVPYAECMLAVQPVTSRTFVNYALDLRAMYIEMRPNQGICDIDLNKAGIQVGIPQMHYKDLITTFVKGKPYETYDFLDGYCY